MQEVPMSCPHAALFTCMPRHVILHPLFAVMRVPGVLGKICPLPLTPRGVCSCGVCSFAR